MKIFGDVEVFKNGRKGLKVEFFAEAIHEKNFFVGCNLNQTESRVEGVEVVCFRIHRKLFGCTELVGGVLKLCLCANPAEEIL
jgi:hypothetical protein